MASVGFRKLVISRLLRMDTEMSNWASDMGIMVWGCLILALAFRQTSALPWTTSYAMASNKIPFKLWHRTGHLRAAR